MKYDPTRAGLERWLGPTEAMLMEHLWSNPRPRTLKQVCFYCKDGRATTTIQTTLNRLVAKGLLRRTKNGVERYHYAPVEPRADWEARQLTQLQESLDGT